jgi:hypothetical protein
VIGLTAQQDQVIGVAQIAGLHGGWIRQRDVAQAAADHQAMLGQLRGPFLAYEKGHVFSAFQQASTKVPARGACTDHQNSHRSTLLDHKRESVRQGDARALPTKVGKPTTARSYDQLQLILIGNNI